MGRAITVALFAAALTLAAPAAALAAGLGKINVLSPLGQPLNAEIEIVALRPGEEETLVARVAPLEAFTAAGIEPGAVLNTMRFAVERRDNRRILRVTTTSPVNDPFVELLVELQWQSGRLVREYTFLLDPPEYKSRELAAAPRAPVAKPAPEPEAKAPPPLEAKPIEPAAPPPPTAPVIAAAPTPPPAAAEPQAEKPAAEPAKPEPAKPEAAKEETKPEPAAPAELAKEPPKEGATPAEPKVYEVKKGDTLGAIARDNLPPGVTLNQMLLAIYRANQDAFLRENVNLVRAGRILNIPTAEEMGTVDADEANRVVRSHMSEFRDYRSRLAAVPAAADDAAGQREPAAGPIEPKPEAPKPAAPQDQVRLSKADPQKPGAAATPAAKAARDDDAVARERALKEAQSRIADLEKNVADLRKLLELKNQQLAELEKKAGAKPAPAAPAPAPTPAPAPAAKAPEKPAAPAPTPAPVAKAPEPAKPAAPVAKPAPKPAPPPPPEPSLIDEFLENPVALAGLGAVVLLLLFYALWAWRKKKTAQAKFTDSVMGAAAAGAAAGATMTEPTLGAATPAGAQPALSQPPAGVAAEEVDPIAEADVYMAYGRDSQAEEILKEALQKDSSRIPVHAKLLEIYAKRKDTKSFEQTALKLKNLTNGAGPGVGQGGGARPVRSIPATACTRAPRRPRPPQRPVAAAAAAPAAPTLDFDIGGAAAPSASAPDLTLETRKPEDTGLDFDVSGAGRQKGRVDRGNRGGIERAGPGRGRPRFQSRPRTVRRPPRRRKSPRRRPRRPTIQG